MNVPLTLPALRRAYASGTLTPTQLVDEIEARIERHNDPAIWITRLSREQMMAYARRVEARGPGELPLFGVPFAIKDNIDLAGVPTTAACPEFSYVPSASAPVVQRLIDAGAIPVGKANLDQFATGLVGVRSPYGVPRNPFRSDVIPGGSSSGSAVAVAAGLVGFALGTDTAGSGRIPAGLNNLVGLKPTRGALSTRGVVPACRSLDCISIFAWTCDDAAAVGAIAEAFDREDPFSRPRPAAPPAETRSTALRVGVPRPDQLQFFGDAEAEQLFHRELSRLRALGAEQVEIDFAPFRESAALLYQGPWIAERWAALRDFHARHAEAFWPVTRQIIEGGRSPTAADTFAAMYQLAGLARRAEHEWEKMDLLLLPTAPRPYTRAQIEAEPIACNTQLGTYTNFVNLLDLSALALPAGIRSDGVPWGVTAVGRAWAEPHLLEFGRQWGRGGESGGGRAGGSDAGVGSDGDVAGSFCEAVGSSSVVVGDEPSNTPRPLDISPVIAIRAPTRNSPLPTTGSQSPIPHRESVRLAVVGAHLSGLPLNRQLTELDAHLVWAGKTAALYRLFALPNTTPPKPGLKRVAADGVAIEVEVWALSTEAFGQFVAAVPSPMCIGTITLETGEAVKGFLCEPIALQAAEDISRYGGWRGYVARKR